MKIKKIFGLGFGIFAVIIGCWLIHISLGMPDFTFLNYGLPGTCILGVGLITIKEVI